MAWIPVATGVVSLKTPPIDPQLPSEPTQSPRARSSLYGSWKVAIECYPLLDPKMYKIWFSRASFSVSFHRLSLAIGS